MILAFPVCLLVVCYAVHGQLGGLGIPVAVKRASVDGQHIPLVISVGIGERNLHAVCPVGHLQELLTERTGENVGHVEHLHRLLHMVIDTAVACSEPHHHAAPDRRYPLVDDLQHLTAGIDFNIDRQILFIAPVRPGSKIRIADAVCRSAPHLIFPVPGVDVLQPPCLMQEVVRGPCRVIRPFLDITAPVPHIHIGAFLEE